jgi:hypothetical protein
MMDIFPRQGMQWRCFSKIYLVGSKELNPKVDPKRNQSKSLFEKKPEIQYHPFIEI